MGWRGFARIALAGGRRRGAAHFRVAASGATPATHVALLDTNGGPQRIHAFEAGSWSSWSFWPLEDGGSHALSAGEGSATVVFLRDGMEVARKPIELRPGEVLEVAPRG